MPGTGRARNQNRAAAIKSFAAQHRIQARNSAGNAFIAHLMLQTERGDRQNAETILVNQERIFVGAVRGAAIFDDAQTASGNLIRYPVVEQDDAIGNVFFESMPGERAVAAFGSDHGCHALVFEPAKQAAQFRSQDSLILQSGKQIFDGIENHALGANAVDGGSPAV